MDESNFRPEIIDGKKEDEDKKMIEEVRAVFREKKRKAFIIHAERGNKGGYAQDIFDMDIAAICLPEAKLWKQIEIISSYDEYLAAIKAFEKYREELNAEINRLKKVNQKTEADILYNSKNNFVSAAGNHYDKFSLKFRKECEEDAGEK
jgi:hypothetical protein